MPELPEVETVRKGLKTLAVGKTIDHIDVKVPSIIVGDSQQFQHKLCGQTLRDVKRRGKFLRLLFDDVEVLSHLRMEGKYFLQAKDEPVDKHVHVRFFFTDHNVLNYRDVRKFGRLQCFPKGEAVNSPSLRLLGVEATDVTGEALFERLKPYRSAIKTVLLNQKVVAGLGNIYVDEVLYLAEVHPECAANTVPEDKCECLAQAMRQVMEKAIEARGTTIRTYTNAFGENGTYQIQLKVYGREGEPCPKCGTTIQKIKVGGRGTHFCPKCQQK